MSIHGKTLLGWCSACPRWALLTPATLTSGVPSWASNPPPSSHTLAYAPDLLCFFPFPSLCTWLIAPHSLAHPPIFCLQQRLSLPISSQGWYCPLTSKCSILPALYMCLTFSKYTLAWNLREHITSRLFPCELHTCSGQRTRQIFFCMGCLTWMNEFVQLLAWILTYFPVFCNSLWIEEDLNWKSNLLLFLPSVLRTGHKPWLPSQPVWWPFHFQTTVKKAEEPGCFSTHLFVFLPAGHICPLTLSETFLFCQTGHYYCIFLIDTSKSLVVTICDISYCVCFYFKCCHNFCQPGGPHAMDFSFCIWVNPSRNPLLSLSGKITW